MGVITAVTSFLGGSFITGIVVYIIGTKLPDIFSQMITDKLKAKIDKDLQKTAHVFEERQQQIIIENEKSLFHLRQEFEIEYQNTEQDFQIRMELLRKGFTVLPDLYYLIEEASACVDQLDIISNKTRIEGKYVELKNFITRNTFFLDTEMCILAKNCENLINDHISIAQKLRKATNNSEILLEKSEEIKKEKKESIELIENEIRKKLA